MIQTPIGRRDFRTLCCGLVLVLGAACSGTGAGQIPCRDTSHCPGDFPTCSAAGFCVNSAPAASINVVSGNAQTAVVGTALAQPLVVKVADTNGNAVAGFALAWAVATGAGKVSTGTTTTGPDGKASITATLGTVAGAFTFTAAGSGLTGSPTTFTATGIPDVATQLVLAGPGSTTAGDAQPFTLTAKDQYGNLAVGYRGNVSFTSNDGAATLPTAYTFSADDSGIHQFSVTLKTAGARSVTAGDGSLTITNPGITVNPASAATLAVTGFSNPVTAGIAGTVSVRARDAFNNTATGYRGTVQITSDNPNTMPPGNYAFTAGDNGQHVFSVTLKKSSSISTFSITATDTATASITGSQTAIVVNPDVAATLQVVGFPNPATAGTGGFVAVTALDVFANTASGYRGTVHVTSTDGAAALPANYTFIMNDAGVHTLAITLKTASASASISVTDTMTPSITGSQGGILVNPGATTKLLLTGFPTSTIAGTPGSLTVTSQDAHNNTTPAYRGTIRFTSPDGAAILPDDYMFRSADNGVHTFTGLVLNSPNASSSIIATDTVTGTITGSIRVSVTSLMFGATATLIAGGTRDGLVFVAGGNTKSDGTGTTLSSTWFYNPATSTLTAGPALALARAFHTAASTGGGQILVAGGKSGAPGFREFELCSLDGATPACTTTAGTLGTSRCNAAAALLSATQVLLAGGDNCTTLTALDSWVVWNSTTPTTTVSNTGGNNLSTGRRLFTATVVGAGKVLLAGGAATATADLFTLGAPSTVAATTGGMQVPRSGHTATVLTATTPTTACPNAATTVCVLIAGGSNTANKTWEVYELASNSFPINASTMGSSDLVNPARSFHAAAAFTGGKVLLAGGTGAGGPLNTTEVFDPTGTLTWASGGGLQANRFEAAAAYAPAQNVLILVGGNATGVSTEQITTP